MKHSELAYIGLGSNINEPHQQIINAINLLSEQEGVTVISNAGFYESKPMGPKDQPDYVNTVVRLRSALSAIDLLSRCQLIEQQQGRVKKRHWGERCIDLDILLYGQLQLETENLIIPHPGICIRDFVYEPLLALDEVIEIPGKGLLRDIIELFY